MRALDVVAGRYARSIRRGIAVARPLGGSTVAAALERVSFTRKAATAEELRARLEEQSKVIRDDPEGDAGRDCRMATVRATALRKLLGALERGEGLEGPTDVQMLRLGELVVFGTPFELFRGVKERVVKETGGGPTLVLSTTNDYQGYAPTKDAYERAADGRVSYARDTVPLIVGAAPYTAALEDEIAAACARLAGDEPGPEG